MRTWTMAVCAALAAAVCAAEPAPLWDLARDAFAATTGRVERAGGVVRMDGESAFAIPNRAFPDAACFTIMMGIRFGALEERSTLQVFDQRVSDTGFAVSATKWGAVGSPLATTVNGVSYGQNSFRAASNQVWQFVLAVRDGVVATYQNKVAGPQYLLRVTPNLAPVWVGRTQARKDMQAVSGYEVLSLKVYGPDFKYYQPGESADMLKNGYVGGPGWLVRLPAQADPKLPRILYYGDSISMGYGGRFCELMKGKAACYHWCHFVGHVDHFPEAAFVAAAGAAPFDVILFNNGLHSLSWTPEKATDAQVQDVVRNMIRAFRKGAPKARLIWASTTPHTAKGRPVAGLGELNPVVVRINTLAAQVLRDEGVESVDLYALLKDRLDLAAGDQYHWSGEAYQLIAEALQRACAARLPQPLPQP